jgi:two-component system, OmpR family, response regulator
MINKPLTVLLVEDSPIIRQVVLESLTSTDNIEVVGFVDSQIKAMQELERFKPNLVIIDLELVQGNGLGVLKELEQAPEKFGSPKKVVFTNHTSPVLKRKCQALDIEGFFDKSYQLDDLLDYVESLSATA